MLRLTDNFAFCLDPTALFFDENRSIARFSVKSLFKVSLKSYKSDEVENQWSCTSAPPYAFVAWTRTTLPRGQQYIIVD